MKRGETFFIENTRGQLIPLSHNNEGVLVVNNQVMRTDTVYASRSPSLNQWGLFAARDIAQGESFIRYEGDLIHDSDWNHEKKTTGYLLVVPQHWPYIGIDAYPYVRTGASARLAGFANHAPINNDACNAEPCLSSPLGLELNHVDQHPVVHLRALRHIKRGEEILWDYGIQHWQERSVEPITATLGKHHGKYYADKDDEDGAEHKHKKHLPHLSRKTVHNVKKNAKRAGKAAKVVAPLVLL